MRALSLFLALGLGACGAQAPAPAAAPTGGSECPFLPEFRQLEPTLAGLSPVQAAVEWDRYMSSHENPEACEAAEVDRRLAALERDLFSIVSNGQHIASQAVFRCNRFDPVTARCEEPMADGTTGPIAPEAGSPLSGLAQPFAVVSELPRAALVGIYVVAMSDALDGRAATRLTTPASEVALPPGAHDVALMAIYETDGSWRYRKAVWYF